MNCVQCAGNTSDLLAMLACRATTANFRRSCLDEKSDFDSPLLDTYARCTRADEQCSADSTCKNAYKAYDDNCESAATTGNPSNCSQSCKTGLSELYADEVGRQLIDQLRMRCLLRCTEVRANDKQSLSVVRRSAYACTAHDVHDDVSDVWRKRSRCDDLERLAGILHVDDALVALINVLDALANDA